MLNNTSSIGNNITNEYNWQVVAGCGRYKINKDTWQVVAGCGKLIYIEQKTLKNNE